MSELIWLNDKNKKELNMKIKHARALSTSLILSLALSGTVNASSPEHHDDTKKHKAVKQGFKLKSYKGGKVVVANRASGTISVIATKNDRVLATIKLPIGENSPEPMYVVHGAKSDSVFVGDRANDRVVVFNDKNFKIKAIIPAGKGVFHMWADPGEYQLWVSNDIDNTMTIIDPITFKVITTLSLPKELIDLGAKPHDVVLDSSGDAAYISLIASEHPKDFVLKYDTHSFIETARAEVGNDPHLSLTRKNKVLYVPTQEDNAVYILNRSDLSLVKILNIPGAHGAAIPRNGDTFYTTNLSGEGVDALYAIDAQTNSIIGEAVNAPFAIPHNVVLNNMANKLYITHSGGQSDKLTVYNVDKESKQASYKKVLTVGKNPFGLAYVE